MKHSLLLSLLLLFCLGVYGQSSTPNQKTNLYSLQTTVDSQQSDITILQESIKSLQTQMTILKGSVDNNHKFVSDTTSNIKDSMDNWLIILTIIIGLIGFVFGVLSPLYFNTFATKNVEKANKNTINAKDIVAKAQNTAKETLNELQHVQAKLDYAEGILADARHALFSVKSFADNIVQIESTVKNLEYDIKKTVAEVDSSFKKVKAVQYFVQALKESDDNNAIELYEKSLKEDPNFTEAENNLRLLKQKNCGDSDKSDIS